jgi:GGDEF domain-containing protein
MLALAFLALTAVLALTQLFRYAGWVSAILGALFFAAAETALLGSASLAAIPVAVTAIALLRAAWLGSLAHGRLSRSVRQLERDRKLIEELRISDEKTGLIKLPYAQQTLKNEILRGQRYNNDLCLLLIQVARLGEGETGLERAEVEDLKVRLAGMLKSTLREVDSAFIDESRLGVILPQTNLGGAMTAAQRVADQAARKLRLDVAIGIASFPSDASKDAELFQAAEAALHIALTSGQPVVFYAQVREAIEPPAPDLAQPDARSLKPATIPAAR